MSTVYSHSRLGCYENCPFSYKLRYLEKIRVEKDTIERFLGNTVHATLEYTYKKVNSENTIPKKEKVAEYFNWKWKKEWKESIFIVKKHKYDKEHYRSIGEKSITRYTERYYPFNQNKILGLEQKIEIKLDPKGKYKMRGVVDRIDETASGEIEIHDYKTGMSTPSQAKIEKDKQLALYQIGVKEFEGEKKITLIWHYLMSGVDFSSNRSEEQLEELKRDTILAIDEVESAKEFPKKPGPLCDYCEYLNHEDGKGGCLCDGEA
ncbi:MAG: PD-(D/E)XK nuclease family protein [Candidatus Firestonebacteria bacterium]